MAGHRVRIGAREVAVEQWPLQVRLRGTHNKFTLSQPEPDLVRLLPGRVVRGLGWAFCILGWPVLLLGLMSIIGLLVRQTFRDAGAVFFLLLCGFPFAFFGVALLGPRYRFDARAGELTIRHFGRTRRRPLADVLAVQVLNAGVFDSRKYSEGGTKFVSYQLNLVLNDPTEPRLFVAFNPDPADMGKKAKQLADFLRVPLLMSAQMRIPQEEKQDSAPPELRSDPTRNWTKTIAPMPPFDLAAGALGGLTLGDSLEQAEFLGRPDPVEQTEDFSRVELDYVGRGFALVFEMGQFVELYCTIALHSADASPKPGQGFSRPRLSGGIELTPETSVAQVQQYFGPPESAENYTRGRALTYCLGRFSMEFEFEKATERLLDWSVKALDD